MRTIRKPSVFLIVLLAFSSSTLALDVQKKAWLSSMENMIPALFCRNESYFRSCFLISPSACHETATKATSYCLEKYSEKIPSTLNQPQDGQEWGSAIGVCAGNFFESENIKEKVKGEQCSNAKNWQ